MRGMITKKDVLSHPLVIIQGFGVKVFIQAVTAPQGKTFLEVISQGIPKPVSKNEIEISNQLDKLIAFEVYSYKIYARLAEYFANVPEASKFFKTLSAQEEAHVEILRIAKVEAARHNVWGSLQPISEHILEKSGKILIHLDLELQKTDPVSLKRALEMVEVVEQAEKEVVFDFLLHFYQLIQSPFLKRIHLIIPSFAEHNAYINTTLPVLKENQARRDRKEKKS